MKKTKYVILILLTAYMMATLLLISPLTKSLFVGIWTHFGAPTLSEGGSLGLMYRAAGLFGFQMVMVIMAWWWAGQDKLNRAAVSLSAVIFTEFAFYFAIH